MKRGGSDKEFLSESSRNGRVPMMGVSDVMEIVCLIQRGGSGRDRMPYTKRW